MCLPRNLLNDIVDEFVEKNKKRLTKHVYFFSALQDLKKKPTYDQTYKEQYNKGLAKGKKRVLQLDKIRNTNIEKILKKDLRILKWWQSI